jgi:hypothetical protein
MDLDKTQEIDLTEKKSEKPNKKRKLDPEIDVDMSEDGEIDDAEIEKVMRQEFRAAANEWLASYGEVTFKLQSQRFNVTQSKKVGKTSPQVASGGGGMEYTPKFSRIVDERDESSKLRARR